MKQIFIAFLVSLSFNAYSQHYTTYSWEENPQLHQLTEKEESESSVGIFKKHIIEYYLNGDQEEPVRYETEHNLIHVNDDNGISRHNTVYIPMFDVEEIVDLKARTINADGKITLLNKDNIKEMKNVEDYGDFKIFAIEGVEKNSEIEVLYTLRKSYEIYGAVSLQGDYPIQKAVCIFIPNGLHHNLKAYRTTKEFISEKFNGFTAEVLTVENIPALIEEEYSTPKANGIEVAYQCFNKGQEITQEMFWSNVSYNIGQQIFATNTPSYVKDDIKKITESKSDISALELAMRIDNFVKSNFSIVKNNNEELTQLDYIFKNKTTSDFGILKVYSQYLTSLEIEHEVVVTANRFQLKFDPEFFLPNMLRDFLIYLPSEKKYIAPGWAENRVGEAPFAILGNYGIFIKRDYEHYFHKIEQADAEFSRIKREMDISFSEDWDYVTVNEYQEYYGNWANTNRAVLGYSSEQAIEQFKDYLTGSGISDKDITHYEVENTDLNQLEYNTPFIVKSTINSESLLEDAGESYIFQVGKVIGTQSELYQETERINPIEMQYPNRYNYSIKITIPNGYEVEGLSALKIDKSYLSDEGEKLAKFESDYQIIENDIVISIEEFYKSISFDINRYEEFRTVINAASDFNKASILIKPSE